MKNILIIILLTGNLCFGQFFENPEEEFSSDNSEMTSPPDQGLDEEDDTDPGNPGDPRVPINQWALLLPLAGLAVGGYYFTRKRLMN